MTKDEHHEGAWCPQCGPDVMVDEDGCCTTCSCDVGLRRLCPGCRSLDGEHDFGPTCTLEEKP